MQSLLQVLTRAQVWFPANPRAWFMRQLRAIGIAAARPRRYLVPSSAKNARIHVCSCAPVARAPTASNTKALMRKCCWVSGLILAYFFADSACGAVPPLTTTDAIVVTATRVKANAFDVPASVDLIDGERLREGRLQINLSEGLAAVPGLMVQNRQNYAQDLQISVRGFGARSAFGVRGVRIYVDGIPATMPDGQSQISNVDLGSVARIEVLRGPFSALYGNSSGGIIQITTEDAADGPVQPEVGSVVGSYATTRLGLKVGGGESSATGLKNYLLSASHFESDGFRAHSKVRRDVANAKWVFQPDAASTLTLVANHVNLPRADDPLGLTRAQFAADPRAVDAVARQFNTRKTVAQTQAGIVAERLFAGGDSLRLTAYTGERATVQYQAIPVATQAVASSAGGVIDLARAYTGADMRWVSRWGARDQTVNLVAGISLDVLNETRRGYQNFSGPANDRRLGVKGTLRRDEKNRIDAFDQYLQADWRITPQWSANAGVRHSRVRFDSRDQYIVTGNPDDSGKVAFQATSPAVGIVFATSPTLNLYATAGRGFETPTGNELAYRPGGQSGLNLSLKSAQSNNVEIGIKTKLMPSLRINAALFRVQTENEIVTQTNSGGRSTFTNAGQTARRGLELAAEKKFSRDLRMQVAYTGLDAAYASPFRTCTAAPCTTPTVTIAAGNRLPGVARHTLFGELVWEPALGLRAAIEARRVSAIAVNDLNSDQADGYTNLNARVGYVFQGSDWRANTFIRVDNLTNRRYAGSVIVNEGNGRFFESAPTRNALVGFSIGRRF